MKKLLLTIIIAILFNASYAQKGISFEDISWKEALEKAEKTNKLIFIDAYTSWCMPCKKMDQEVFTLDSVGKFFNANFINLKIDMEKEQGRTIAKMYPVTFYPTYLFIDGKGNVVHRSGSRMDASAFLNQARFALSPDFSLAAMQKSYRTGKMDNGQLFRYAVALKKFDKSLSEKVISELLSKLSDEDLKSRLGWDIINEFAKTETDRLGINLFQNEAFYIKLAGAEDVGKVTQKLKTTTMYGLMREKNAKEFLSHLTYFTKSNDLALQQVGAVLEISYYLENENTPAFLEASNRALLGVLHNNADQLSYITRTIVRPEKIKDPQLLGMAYKFSKRAIALKPDDYSIEGTHALACYALGYKQEALAAAIAARKQAESMTSKMQANAQKLYDKINRM